MVNKFIFFAYNGFWYLTDVDRCCIFNVDRCWMIDVDRWTALPVGRMAETCSFPSSLCSILICFIASLLYSSFCLIIFIISFCMHGVCCHSGHVVVVSHSSGLLSTDSSGGVSVDFVWALSIDVAVWVSIDAEYSVSYSPQWQAAMIPGSLILLEVVCGFLTGIES